MREKLRSRRGISLTELLMAMLVVSLVSMAVAVGVSTAWKVHRQSVEFSESRVLYDTLTQAVTDELHYARDVKTGSDGTVTGFTSSTNLADSSFSANAQGQLTLGGQLLVSSGAYSKGTLKANLTELSYTNGIFSAILTVTDKAGNTLKTGQLTVSALNN